MKRFFSLLVMLSILCVGSIGCSDKSTATKKTEVSTPNGSTTTTQKTEVEKSGENPPPAQK
jgi:hypothetical protein